MDEPTRGVDVGAKQEIHDIDHNLAGQGKGIMTLLLGAPDGAVAADRIVLMCEGRVVAL